MTKDVPKPIRKPGVMLQSFFPSPPPCADYIAMNAAATEPTKPHLREV